MRCPPDKKYIPGVGCVPITDETSYVLRATGAEISTCSPGAYVCAQGDTACYDRGKASTAINVYADTIYQGSTGVVTMELVDQQGMAVANRSLSFTLYRPDGSVDKSGAGFVTNANGLVSFSFTPTMQGNYTVTVSFAGDSLYAASSASVGLNVKVQVNYDYKVSSNVVLNASGGTAYTGTDFAAALNWAVSHANAKVYVPAGTYTITGGIAQRIDDFASGVTLFGDGPDKTIFDFVWNGTFTSHYNTYGWEFNYGFWAENVSNVTMKKFSVTGDGGVTFSTTSGTTSNNTFEDITVFDTSHHCMNAFSCYAESGCNANSTRFIRCIADNVGGNGFGLMGKGTSPLGKVNSPYFEDCRSLYAGYSAHRWNWAVGFDLREGCDVTNVELVRCEATGSWESGFHFEYSTADIGWVKFTDCVASYNGQKYYQPLGAYWGGGYMCAHSCYPDRITDPESGTEYYFTNCTGTGNAGNLLMCGHRYDGGEVDTVFGYTYLIKSGDNKVYGSNGTTVAYTATSATAALQWAVSHANAVVWVRSGTYSLTADVTLANGVFLVGDLPTWDTVPSATYLSFPSTGTTGLILGSNCTVSCIGINYGNVKVNATAAVSGIALKGVNFVSTARTAAVLLTASGSGSISNTFLGNVHLLNSTVTGYSASGNVTGTTRLLSSV